MTTADCIFCKIVAGDIPAARIYEDDHVLAFLDIGPLSQGHTLVIPKTHAATVAVCPDEVLSQVAAVLGRIARAVVEVTRCDGYNVLCNNGRAAGQLVNHLHFHIIPRMDNDNLFNRWASGQYPEGKMAELAELIKAKIR